MNTFIHPKTKLRTLDKQVLKNMVQSGVYATRAVLVAHGNTESIWITPTEDCYKRFIEDNGSYDQALEAYVMEPPKAFPFPQGTILPFRTRGKHRPILDVPTLVQELIANGVPKESITAFKSNPHED